MLPARFTAGENRLGGPLPSEIFQLPNMEVIWLNSNNITGSIPSELGHATNLLALDITGNHLTGEIPSTIGDLTKLKVLMLGGNGLQGPESIREFISKTVVGNVQRCQVNHA